MSENKAPAAPEQDCQECNYQDEVTGACTNDVAECVDGSQFVKAFGPEDIYKTLFMLIYELTGQVEVSVESLEKDFVEGEMMIEKPEYDPRTEKYILRTDPQPPKPKLIAVPKKLMKRRRVVYPGGN